eukprot:TRINITY_DN12581_c0_g1_i1.p1 TRINITY_DN12581_c0_g1~~TRINITY_DN12581_c0_g1_i1.p1  ORF type:complete len:442 (-),score=83.34 TRINITY_DN12581_c0_g1_i1:52-1377(-)
MSVSSRPQFILGVAVALVALLCLVEAQRNEIKNLPGLGYTPTFRQFSGEVTVDQKHGRNLFYWLVESQNDPSTDPLVIWFNGGPGCSSLIGFLTENGPFKPSYGEYDLEENPYSWNRIANVLYIEAPAGVGFSYSNDPSDYNTNNKKTAADNYVFLNLWLKLFPEYFNRPLWITGESYAGDYVPDLMTLILEGDGPLKNNLKGTLLGNPVIDCVEQRNIENELQMQLFLQHAAIPYTEYLDWKSLGCVGNSNAKICSKFVNSITTRLQNESQLDPDNLYTNVCTGNATLDISDSVPHCETLQDKRTAYYNRPDVQEAIFAHPAKWEGCTDILNYTTTFPTTMPIYEYFFEKHPSLRILIYSGDVDIATVPHIMTQVCIAHLPITQVGDWRSYHVDGIVGGWVQDYDRLTYATVKGAGHEVPMYVPSAAYYLFSKFINGERI